MADILSLFLDMKKEEIINLCQWYNMAQKEDLAICDKYIIKFKEIDIYKDLHLKKDNTHKYPKIIKYLDTKID